MIDNSQQIKLIVCTQSSPKHEVHRYVTISPQGIKFHSDTLTIKITNNGYIYIDFDIEREKDVYGTTPLELLERLRGNWICSKWIYPVNQIDKFVLSTSQLIQLIRDELKKVDQHEPNN